jgi:cytochrome b subunit of formate dehydrogenase
MLGLFIVIVKFRYLANIFILTIMQVSSVYHNYSGLLNFGDLLQTSLVLKIRVKPQYVEM